MVKLEEPDKGQAWVIAIAACLVSMVVAGLSRIRPLLYIAVIETYDVSRKDAAQPFAVRGSISCLVGPIVGVVGQRYGVKATTFWGGVICSMGIALSCIAPNVFWLTVFWGGLFGFGNGLADTLYPVLINQYFVKHKATASGIAVSGRSIGAFVLPVITKFALGAFGLSGGFLILGGIAMHILPISLLLKSPQWLENPKQYARIKALKMKQQTAGSLAKSLPGAPPEEGTKNGSTSTEKSSSIPISTISGDLEKIKREIISSAPCEKTCDVSSVKKTSLLESIRGIGTLYTSPVFVLICVCMAMYTIIYLPVLTVIVDYGKDKGIDESYGIYIINSVAVGDLIGPLCFGWVTDKEILSVPTCLAMTFILKAVFIFLLPLVTNLYSYMLLLALYGITYGTVMTHFPLLILRYVDRNLQSLAIGSEGFLSGVVSFAVPSMVGYFRDIVGSYDGMFYFLGTISVVAGCLWLLIPSLAEFQLKKVEQNRI